jgi:hypothetical protein
VLTNLRAQPRVVPAARLRDRGILSVAEFEAAKAKVLGS